MSLKISTFLNDFIGKTSFIIFFFLLLLILLRKGVFQGSASVAELRFWF